MLTTSIGPFIFLNFHIDYFLILLVHKKAQKGLKTGLLGIFLGQKNQKIVNMKIMGKKGLRSSPEHYKEEKNKIILFCILKEAGSFERWPLINM